MLVQQQLFKFYGEIWNGVRLVAVVVVTTLVGD